MEGSRKIGRAEHTGTTMKRALPPRDDKAGDDFSVALTRLSLVRLLPSRARLRFTRYTQFNASPSFTLLSDQGTRSSIGPGFPAVPEVHAHRDRPFAGHRPSRRLIRCAPITPL